MVLGRIIAKRSLKKFRKITVSNLKKSNVLLSSSILVEDKSLKSTIECSQYLMVNSLDLFILSFNYLSTKENWDKVLFSRIMALYIIDFYDTIFPLIGRDLVHEVEKFSDSKTIDSIKLITKKISKIKKESESKLKHIRNVTIGHKSNSGNYLFEQIEKIDHKEINNFSTELTGLMTKLSSQLVEILKSYRDKKY